MTKVKNTRRRIVESSSSSSSEDDSDYETIDSDDEEDNDDETESETETEKSPAPPPRKKSAPPPPKKSKSPHKHRRAAAASASESDSSDESDDDTSNPQQYNIFIAAAPPSSSHAQEYMDYFGGGDNDSELEVSKDKDEDYTSEDERNFMKEKYEKIASTEDLLTPDEIKRREKRAAAAAAHAEEKRNKDTKDAYPEYKELLDLKKQLMENLKLAPKNKILHNAIRDCDKSIKKLIKDARNSNATNYISLIKKTTAPQKVGEVDFFKKKLSNVEQLKIMKELTEINQHIFVEKPYRLALLETKIPAKYKAIALQKLNLLKNMEPGDNEYYKVKTWVDTFMRVPFGVYRSLTVSREDGMEACNHFIQNAKQILDDCVYGLDDAKLQILQMVGQWMSNPASMGTAIAIRGPMGTGKTSLIKDGVSKIFGREFAFLPLGGATDSSYLEGHSYTYEGSQWGRIVQILIDGKSMNPVIFFDELDKVSDTPRGEEIIGILTHLTDTTQNSQFHDKYFSELDFDLSKCLFVFSYNDETKINPILRDRMYVIQTKGYEAKDKLVIAKKYLLPKIREQVSFTEGEVVIPDDVLQYIIGNPEMTRGEEGVRNLKRCLEIIHTKLNLYRLVKPGTDIFGANIGLEIVEFPYTLTKKAVDILIKNTDKTQNHSLLSMYI